MVKVDPVAANRIQTEFIEKELKAVSLRTDFTLNVRRMANEVVSDKVTNSTMTSPRPGTNAMPTPRNEGASALAGAGRSMMGATGGCPPVSEQVDSIEGMVEELREEIRRPKRTPRELYAEPLTSSMRIGWDLGARDMADFRTVGPTAMRWRRPKVSTELSNYCNLYCKMYGYSPYAQKGVQG